MDFRCRANKSRPTLLLLTALTARSTVRSECSVNATLRAIVCLITLVPHQLINDQCSCSSVLSHSLSHTHTLSPTLCLSHAHTHTRHWSSLRPLWGSSSDVTDWQSCLYVNVSSCATVARLLLICSHGQRARRGWRELGSDSRRAWCDQSNACHHTRRPVRIKQTRASNKILIIPSVAIII